MNHKRRARTCRAHAHIQDEMGSGKKKKYETKIYCENITKSTTTARPTVLYICVTKIANGTIMKNYKRYNKHLPYVLYTRIKMLF